MAAADAARRGLTLHQVEQHARRVADSVRLVATLPDLAHLARSGRVPGIAERARRRLGVAPIFEFVDGKARPRRPALTFDAALSRIAAEVNRTMPANATGYRGASERRPVARVAALHALAPHSAERLLELVRQDVEPVDAFVGEFSAVMVAHTGPGLAGLAWYWS
jgi:fatty acid-binding protein DegV